MKNLQRFDVDSKGRHKEIAPAGGTAKGDKSKNTSNIIPFPLERVKRKEHNHED